MQKFLFIASNEWVRWGGSESLWSQAAEKLASKGIDVRVSVRDWGEPIPEIESLRSAGCQIFHRRPPKLRSRLARRIFPLPDYQRAHVAVAGDGVDLVVISQGDNMDGLGWMEVAGAAGLKYAVIAQVAAQEWWPNDD